MAEEEKNKEEEEKSKLKKYQIGQQILTQADIEKILTVKGETFTIKFPTPLQQEQIEREVAIRLGGNPLDSFPQVTYNLIRMNVTLDNIIIKAPDWWKGAGECFDEDLVTKLWEEYLKEKDAFRGSLRQGKFKQ